MASARKVATSQRTSCSACGGRSLEQVIDLPRLPLTGIFVRPESRSDFLDFDQALLRCESCGHGQLRDTIDPQYLYQDTYTHRSSLSPIATRGNDFFLRFVEDVVRDRHFRSIVEIGCNDLYLLTKLRTRGDRLAGFDPIWRDRPADDSSPIFVSGKYIEEIEPAADIAVRPDLVLSVHTLEHVNDPLQSLRPIFDHAAPDAIFIIEVPSLDTLLTIGRFDQVFHQHLNYFSLASIHRMIVELGGELIDSRLNYQYWLGTMMVAFRKRDTRVGATVTPSNSTNEIVRAYDEYRRFMASTAATLDHLERRGVRLVGFGAAQMVPTLAYHLGSDLQQLAAIYDDNVDKTGLTYPSIATTIRPAPEAEGLDGLGVLVTALDSARPIVQRLTAMKAKYVLVPAGVF